MASSGSGGVRHQITANSGHVEDDACGFGLVERSQHVIQNHTQGRSPSLAGLLKKGFELL